MAPATWDELRKRQTMVRAYRSRFVSAYMKSVRLRRPEDAMYWLGVLYHGNAGLEYLWKRLLRSAGEDNFDVWIMEHCARLLAGKERKLEPLLYGAYLSCLGTKWYELPDGIDYCQVRSAANKAPHGEDPIAGQETLLTRYRAAMTRRDVADAFWVIAEVQKLELRPWRFYTAAAEAGAASEHPAARRIAAIIQQHYGWLAPVGEKNHLWQLLYTLCRAPLTSTGRQANEREYERLRNAALARLERPLEAAPSWAMDGVHTGGSDPRFAGDYEGVWNMIAMHRRDGKLDPDRPGVTLQAGQRRAHR